MTVKRKTYVYRVMAQTTARFFLLAGLMACVPTGTASRVSVKDTQLGGLPCNGTSIEISKLDLDAAILIYFDTQQLERSGYFDGKTVREFSLYGYDYNGYKEMNKIFDNAEHYTKDIISPYLYDGEKDKNGICDIKKNRTTHCISAMFIFQNLNRHSGICPRGPNKRSDWNYKMIPYCSGPNDKARFIASSYQNLSGEDSFMRSAIFVESGNIQGIWSNIADKGYDVVIYTDNTNVSDYHIRLAASWNFIYTNLVVSGEHDFLFNKVKYNQITDNIESDVEICNI